MMTSRSDPLSAKMMRRIYETQHEAGQYCHANEFLKLLMENRERLTPQQAKTLRGQAIAGDLAGAHKGLRKILNGGEDA